MSDTEVDPLQIGTDTSSQKHLDDSNKISSDDDYLNSVKEFLALSSVSDISDSEPEPCTNTSTSSFSHKKCRATDKPDDDKIRGGKGSSSTLRRSARMSASLYKDYSHVTTFKALPSIKLTLNLRNLPKCKLNDSSSPVKKSRKHKKSKDETEKTHAALSTEELKQLLEEVTECPNTGGELLLPQPTMHRYESTRLMTKSNSKKNRSPVSPEGTKGVVVKSDGDRHKTGGHHKHGHNTNNNNIVLPKTRKQKRIQTAASKKFQKLKNACRRQFGHKDFSTNKQPTALTTGKLSKIEKVKEAELPPQILTVEKNKIKATVEFLQDTKNDTESKTTTSVIVENINEKNLQAEDNQNHNLINTSSSERSTDGNTTNPLPVNNPNKSGIGKHNLPISIPERRSSIAEPLRACTKTPSCEISVISPKTDDYSKSETKTITEKDTTMIYVKSPEDLNKENPAPLISSPFKNFDKTSELLNKISRPSSPHLPHQPIENDPDVCIIEDISNPDQNEVTNKNIEKCPTPEVTKTVPSKEIIFDNNILSCPGYTTNPRRNSISTMDLFSRPSMALKRAISTGIIHKISPSKSLKSSNVRLQQQNNTKNKPEKALTTKHKKTEDDGPEPKRLRDNLNIQQSDTITSLPVIPHARYASAPINYSITPPTATTSPNSISFRPPVNITGGTSYEQFYSPPQDLCNLARMHYERLARYNNTVTTEPESLQTTQSSIHRNKSYEVDQNQTNAVINQAGEINNTYTPVVAPLRDKPTELYLTQCHPLNKSKSSTIRTSMHENVMPSSATGSIATNKCDEHTINHLQEVNLPQSNYNYIANPFHRPIQTSPLTISDSSSAADTDIELEVDVVGNDSIEDKSTHTTYSKIMIKQKPETASEQLSSYIPTGDRIMTMPTSSPVLSNSPTEFIEEIQKLRNIIFILLERMGSQCSEQELQYIRQIFQSSIVPASQLRSNDLLPIHNSDSRTTSSQTVTRGIENRGRRNVSPSVKESGNNNSSRTRSVITVRDQISPQTKPQALQQVINDVINESLKQSDKTIPHTNTPLLNTYPSTNTTPRDYSNPSLQLQYALHAGYNMARTTNPYREQPPEYYTANGYNPTNNPREDKNARLPHSDQNLDHSAFLKEFSKMMYNKEMKKQTVPDPYSKRYLPPQPPPLLHHPQPQYKSIQPKTKEKSCSSTSCQERSGIKPPVSERPPVIYTTNINPRELKPGHTDFRQAVSLANSIFDDYIAKEVPARSTSIDESNVCSPDSGYISPLRKISPPLQQNSDSKYISKRRSSVYESPDAIKLLPQTTTTSIITDQQISEQIIQRLLLKLHHCGTLTPEQYVKEMYALEREQCPPFLLQFYSYVTKRQISSNQLPISFKIFLEFKSAGKLKMYENSFALYAKKRQQERYLKRC